MPPKSSKMGRFSTTPGLVPKVKAILRDAGERMPLLSIEEIAENLRQKNSTFKRRPFGPFANKVREAYTVARRDLADEATHAGICSSKKRSSDEHDSDAEPSSSTPMMVVTESSGNLLNRSLHSRYKDTNKEKQPIPVIPLVAAEPPSGSEKAPALRGKRRRTTAGRRTAGGAQTAAAVGESLGITSQPADDAQRVFDITRPSVTYADVGGMESCLQDLRELTQVVFSHPECFSHIHANPPKGVLLHGPPGCGKTLLAHAMAGEMQLPMLKVAAPALIGGTSGSSEKAIRDLLSQAVAEAQADGRGCLVFIDEIDVIATKRETAQREMERRIVAQLLSSLDELTLEASGKPVMVIGATSRPDSLDPALRRSGRFDREIALPMPDKASRLHILDVMCRRLRVGDDVELEWLAARTPGFVGADMQALINEAAMHAVLRGVRTLTDTQTEETPIESEDGETSMAVDVVEDEEKGDALPNPGAISAPSTPGTSITTEERKLASHAISAHLQPFTTEQLAGLSVDVDDFEYALTKIQPSAKREGFATTPEVTWDDVGALAQPRRELEEAITFPLMAPEQCRKVGIHKPPGVLMYGPPGCGKTLLAKAVANGCAANFISVKGPELLNKFVGESERAVRQVFQRARTSSPCVIFFDELDALCPKRGDSANSRVSERIVNQLLTELDGFDGSSKTQVFVIGATNRPDILDPAMLRPGRLEKLVYVDLPEENARKEILKTLVRNVELASDVDIGVIARDARCEGYSGADLAALVRESGVTALRRLLANSVNIGIYTLDSIGDNPTISHSDFDKAFDKVLPSVSKRDLARYRGLRKKLRGIRAQIPTSGMDETPTTKS